MRSLPIAGNFVDPENARHPVEVTPYALLPLRT
jgi:hypothetical protein